MVWLWLLRCRHQLADERFGVLGYCLRSAGGFKEVARTHDELTQITEARFAFSDGQLAWRMRDGHRINGRVGGGVLGVERG